MVYSRKIRYAILIIILQSIFSCNPETDSEKLHWDYAIIKSRLESLMIQRDSLTASSLRPLELKLSVFTAASFYEEKAAALKNKQYDVDTKYTADYVEVS